MERCPICGSVDFEVLDMGEVCNSCDYYSYDDDSPDNDEWSYDNDED